MRPKESTPKHCFAAPDSPVVVFFQLTD